jgi:anti-anti-sigma factor
MQSEQLFDSRSGSLPALLVDLHCRDSEPPRMLVFGELDAVTAGPLQKAVVDLLREQRPHCIQLDLHGVSFLDSAGIRALLLCQADAQQADCQIRLTKPQPAVYRVLQITGLLEHFGLTEPPPPDQPQAETPCAPSSPANLQVFN